MERQFDGIYIPAEIWNAKDLNWNEKILLMEINSYTRNGKDCFISNEYIAKFLNITETSGNRILSSLIKKGYVDKVRFDGRRRFIKSNIVVQVKANLSQSAEQGCHKRQGSVVANDNILYTDTNSNITNKKDIDKSISKESEIEVENFGEETITPTNKETPKEKSSAKKEKVTGATIEERANQFYNELSGYVGKYPKEIIRAFYDYWTEKNRSKTKMKFEQQQTWETSLRLARWYHNNKNKTTNNYGKQSNDEFGNGTAIGKANREQYEGETTA